MQPSSFCATIVIVAIQPSSPANSKLIQPSLPYISANAFYDAHTYQHLSRFVFSNLPFAFIDFQ